MKNKKPFLNLILLITILTISLFVGCTKENSGGIVYFKNIDGETLYSITINYGESASYVGETPIYPPNLVISDEYEYIFDGWDKNTENITSFPYTVTATYKAELISYQEFEFEIISEKPTTYQVKKYTGTSKDVVIPSTYNEYEVVEIAENAFLGQTNITSIFIPSTISRINETFKDCYLLESIVVDYENPYYDSRENCNAIIETESNTLIVGSSKTAIPETVKKIEKYAFYGRNLDTLELPSKIIEIADEAFYSSTIISLQISENSSLQEIGLNAFSHCQNLQKINLENCKNLLKIGENCFEMTKISKINLSNSKITSISDYAFFNCNLLKSVTLPVTLEKICEYSFFNTSLSSIEIPSSVKEIEKSAFEYCSLESDFGITITENSNLSYIGESAFASTNIKSITFLNNSIGIVIDNNAFKNCFGLSHLNFSKNILYIGDSAFENCDEIQIVTFDENSLLQSINKSAFENCTMLTTLELPLYGNLTEIDDRAFYNTNLAYVYIPKTVNKIFNSSFSSTIPILFEGDKLEAIENKFTLENKISISRPIYENVEKDNFVKYGEAIYLLDGENYMLITCIQNFGTFIVPDLINNIPVTKIADMAFFSKTLLEDVVLGNNIKEIGSCSFYGCYSLWQSKSYIQLPTNLNSIGTGAFYGLVLPSVIIGTSQSNFTSAKIEAYSFSNNTKIFMYFTQSEYYNIFETESVWDWIFSPIFLPNWKINQDGSPTII